MEKCKGCIHENVCEHRANIQTDTYAYMGVKYDTEKCEHYMPADVASEVEELIYKLECLLCHATGNRLSKHTYDLRTMESAVTDYVEKCCDEARFEAKSGVAQEIFAEFELHIRKAVEGWQKQLKFEIEKYKMDMIMARLDAFGYCIYVLNNLREKYTEGETNGNKAGTEI